MARKKPPRYTTPPNALKQKVGDGGIPAHVIAQSQKYLETNPVDFTPQGLRFLNDLQGLKTNIEQGHGDPAMLFQKINTPVIQLKANGSMFHYQLISMISDVFANFLEKTRMVDEDFITIFSTYLKILGIVLHKKLTGTGGNEGYALTQELQNACLRYYNKHDIV